MMAVSLGVEMHVFVTYVEDPAQKDNDHVELPSIIACVLYSLVTFAFIDCSFKETEPLLSRTPYRLRCCACADRDEDLCYACALRRASGSFGGDSARRVAAKVKYDLKYCSHPEHLRYRPHPCDGEEVDFLLESTSSPSAPWTSLRFAVRSFFDRGRELAHDLNEREISSLDLATLTGSAACKNGERAYFEVRVMAAGHLHVGWLNKRNGSVWFLDCARKRLLCMCPLFTGRKQTTVLVSQEKLCTKHVSPGDTVGLMCDLKRGKIRFTINGHEAALDGFEFDVPKVNLFNLVDGHMYSEYPLQTNYHKSICRIPCMISICTMLLFPANADMPVFL